MLKAWLVVIIIGKGGPGTEKQEGEALYKLIGKVGVVICKFLYEKQGVLYLIFRELKHATLFSHGR